ncbi:hypothetical protein GE061_017688 [Apolygus lucorum]|uniref:Uncharacterized protein n=1 Tax=Apolygus lucorum TaxID=248454 RepID=A0A8S9XFQ3_APOLU|nr:hypothetical protein GE061_017688 [Apolygus lucorum]
MDSWKRARKENCNSLSKFNGLHFKGLRSTMLLICAAFVFSAGVTMSQDVDFPETSGMNNFSKKRDFKSLFEYLGRSNALYVLHMEKLLGLWEDALPDEMSDVYQAMNESIHTLMDFRGAFLHYLQDLKVADLTKMEVHISSEDVVDWRGVTDKGIEAIHVFDEFMRNSMDTDFPMISIVNTTSTSDLPLFILEMNKVVDCSGQIIQFLSDYLDNKFKRAVSTKPLRNISNRFYKLHKKIDKLAEPYLEQDGDVSKYKIKREEIFKKLIQMTLSIRSLRDALYHIRQPRS